MPTQHAELWSRLSAFTLDDPDSELTFSRRLARENGWGIGYAQRVIEEYKRFVYLAMVAGHPVTPSDQVDQAWHLHLTYTESYWNDLCGTVLGRPLHHGPTRGGPKENAKYNDWYERTKASYRVHFGMEPPADIWPEARIRFGEDLAFRRVNVARNWVVPRLFSLRWGRGTYTAIAGLLPASILAAAWNPLDFRGAEFLFLFFALLLGTGLCAAALRYFLRKDAGEAEQPAPSEVLDPYEAIYLIGGKSMVNQSAFVALFRADALQLEKRWSTTNMTCKGALPSYAHPVERSLYEAIQAHGSASVELLKVNLSAIADLQSSLVSKGLIESARSMFWPRAAAVLCFCPLLLLGIAKLIVGILRDRPVGFLVLAMVPTIILMLCLGLIMPRCTRAGLRVIKKLKETKLGSETAKQLSDSMTLDPMLTWMIVTAGLFSVIPPGDPLRSILTPANAGGDRGDTGGCGTSSGDGGGGGGCGGGGCGGGGCGGCGG